MDVFYPLRLGIELHHIDPQYMLFLSFVDNLFINPLLVIIHIHIHTYTYTPIHIHIYQSIQTNTDTYTFKEEKGKREKMEIVKKK